MSAYQFRKFQTLLLSSPSPEILVIKLNRPEVRNALNTIMMEELGNIWRGLYLDDCGLRAVILTGVGDKAFCAGADLKERQIMDARKWQHQHALLEQAMRSMLECPLPIIAAVNGAAIGGGLELLLTCDFAYSVPDARLAFPETKLGIIPGAMGTQWLPRLIGLNRAKELCLTGEAFSAAQGYEWGMINKLVELEKLESVTLEAANKITKNAPIAVRQIKKALNATLSTDFNTGYGIEIEGHLNCVKTADRIVGVNAFNEKRVPAFRGE